MFLLLLVICLVSILLLVQLQNLKRSRGGISISPTRSEEHTHTHTPQKTLLGILSNFCSIDTSIMTVLKLLTEHCWSNRKWWTGQLSRMMLAGSGTTATETPTCLEKALFASSPSLSSLSFLMERFWSQKASSSNPSPQFMIWTCFLFWGEGAQGLLKVM